MNTVVIQILILQAVLTGVMVASSAWGHYRNQKAMKELLARKTHIRL